MKIAVALKGNISLSNVLLTVKYNEVVAINIVSEVTTLINHQRFSIKDFSVFMSFKNIEN